MLCGFACGLGSLLLLLLLLLLVALLPLLFLLLQNLVFVAGLGGAEGAWLGGRNLVALGQLVNRLGRLGGAGL